MVHKRKIKQNKNTTQYALDITMRKQTQITYIRHEPPYTQLEVKANWGLFLSELTLAISQRTFGLYSETCLIRHYAEPNNYVGFDGVSEYSGVSITRTNVVI
jgi:hypothetical protein